MSKTVRFALGVAGAAPAIGLMMPAGIAAATPAHSSGKTVKDASLHSHQYVIHPDADCAGSRVHTATAGDLKLKFWSAPVGSRTCIGTIVVDSTGPAGGSEHVRGWVDTNNGAGFCQMRAAGGHLSDGCKQIFIRGGLRVVAYASSGMFFRGSIVDSYPF